MKVSTLVLCTALLWMSTSVRAQEPSPSLPAIAYIYPAGGQAGTTVDVALAGLDWTPDMEFFVLESDVDLEIVGPLGDMIVPEPPYWFGAKGRSGALPIPREVPARLTIPEDRAPGPIHWQVANANGVSARGRFWVSRTTEVVEERHRRAPQLLPALPVIVSGQVMRIEEVDRFRFAAPVAGPVTIDSFARRLGSPLNAALKVSDGSGNVLVDEVDTEGRDLTVTFAARAGGEYLVSLHDLDYRGNRTFRYRLQITQGPRIVATRPAAGQRGQTQEVEFIGYGLRSEQARLETVSRSVSFEAKSDQAAAMPFTLETLVGSVQHEFSLSDTPELSEAALESQTAATAGKREMTVPGAITGTLLPGETDHYEFTARKDEVWPMSLRQASSDARLDLVLAVHESEGKELARADDLPGTTDAGLTFTVPADGTYRVEVSDLSGRPRSEASVYRLAVVPPRPGFKLTIPEQLPAPIGAKTEFSVKADRVGGFKEPIRLTVEGLFDGATTADELVIAADASELKIAVNVSADAPAKASPLRVSGVAGEGTARIERQSGAMLFATTMKPLAKVTPVDREGGRTVHAGTTYPAMVIIDRYRDYDGDVLLQMAAGQSRHRQGINAGDVLVPAGESRVPFPVYMPEWLETSRTSRMICNALVHVPDPRGNKRWIASKMDGRITMSVEGALMNLSNGAKELIARPGDTLEIPLQLFRSVKLNEQTTLELVPDEVNSGLLKAESVVIEPGRAETVFRVTSANDDRLLGRQKFIVRATAMQDGKYPAVAHTTVELEFVR